MRTCTNTCTLFHIFLHILLHILHDAVLELLNSLHLPTMHPVMLSVYIYIVLVIFIVPGQPSIMVPSTTSTSISLSWSVPSGSVVTSYEVMWQRDTSVGCSDEDEGSITITGGSTSYEIMGLAGVSSYTISVTAVNAAGSSAVSDTVTAMTEEAGER